MKKIKSWFLRDRSFKEKFLSQKFLLLIVVLASILRFSGLNYSHYYGDETKALYLDKTETATKFLLDQRKGPGQFVTAWIMEKLSGGYSEGIIRLPFAVAGVLGVVVLYLLVQSMFGEVSARVSALLFAFSGLNIAFSRIVQYQSLLIFFGLLGIYLVHRYKLSSKIPFLALASVSYGVAFLCHYDAVFFIVPGLLLFFLNEKLTGKKALIFVAPMLVLIASFYVPYVLSSNFLVNTTGYLQKRVTGDEYLPNNSLYTLKIYNPLYISFVLLSFAFFAFAKGFKSGVAIVFSWFLVPFIVFEFVFSNPGTHINNYMLPVYVLAGVGAANFAQAIKKPKYLKLFNYATGIILTASFLIALVIFVPAFKNGYPWNYPVDKQYHLYLYGFPYYRSWDKIHDYLYAKQGVRNFYTNDNAVTAKYYLLKYDLSQPGSNFLPQYYIYVPKGQEFKAPAEGFFQSYTVDKEFWENGVLLATVYKLRTL